jgi:hypothetical protein
MAYKRLNLSRRKGSSRLSGLPTLCLALFLASGMTITFAGCASSAETAPLADPGGATASTPPASNPVAVEPPSLPRVPSGATVHIRLLQSISSRSARSGDEFQAELSEPITPPGADAFPKGARVHGRIVTASPSGRLHSPGHLRLALDSVQASDGRWIQFATSSISLNGGNHKRRNQTLIGGGTGFGALIGGIAGGGVGLAIGAASGAGAGFAGAYITGRKDVSLNAEGQLMFKTTREVSLQP